MELFQSRYLTYLLDSITIKERICTERKSQGLVFPPTSDFQKEVANLFKQACEFCQKIGFDSAATKISHSHVRLSSIKDTWDYSTLLTEMKNARDMLFDNHWEHSFVAIPKEYKELVNKDDLFGPEVSTAFKNAIPDIREAGNCIAVDMGTASVFHQMRAVEWGLRALCVHLGVNRIRKSKKPNKKKYVALPWAQWEQMIVAAQVKANKKIDDLGPGKRKQDLQEFYVPVFQEIRDFKDAFRNHVMHGRKAYNRKDAEALMGHSRRFMTLLATRVSDNEVYEI